MSLLSFNVGIELGQLLVLLGALPALALLFRHALAARFGVLILSALLAHTGWHWMLDRGAKLWGIEWPTLDAASAVTLARWAVLLLLIGGAAWFIARRLARHPEAQKPATQEDLA
jgi:hypothetical protein